VAGFTWGRLLSTLESLGMAGCSSDLGQIYKPNILGLEKRFSMLSLNSYQNKKFVNDFVSKNGRLDACPIVQN
jgi:hypothetical protein